MRRQRVVPAVAAPAAALALLALATAAARAQTAAPDLQAWWAAANPAALAEATSQIVRSGPDFEDVYEALAAGRHYERDVPLGTLELTHTNRDGFLHRYILMVPASYDPSRSYPVRMYLHGGVFRPDPGAGGSWFRSPDRFASEDHLVIAPLSWSETLWWQAHQVENLRGILNDLKGTYNIDENRVHAMGVSDGGTGVYFLAFRDPTPWSSFLPFIGSPGVLMNPAVGADGRMHLGNLKNRPFFIVNGETDRLYPVSSIRPWLSSFDAIGVDYEFRPQQSGHDVSWWPSEAERIDRFAAERRRDPHPESMVWATESPEAYPRAHWLIIDELGSTRGDAERDALSAWVASADSGILWATREGNTVEVLAYQVRRFRVLVSPDAFDLTRPIRVEVNGSVAFDGLVSPSVETLLDWAGRDQDRTMLYAAELTLEPVR
ncbi:MAG TPA: hypothetical protein EYM78_02100 [Gemmatimonadetes bacterium]|nr:hypothetical protein [Gemmatimonadota bacterium]